MRLLTTLAFLFALVLASTASATSWTPGDIAPPNNPDNRIGIDDVVGTMQASLGLRSLNDHELLLADVAPARIVPIGENGETIAYVAGDNRVNIADVVLMLRAAVELTHIYWEFHEISIVATRSADLWGWQAEFNGLPPWHSDGGASFLGSPEELALVNSTFGPPARMLVAYTNLRHVECGDKLGALIVHSPFPISSTDAEISAEVVYDVGAGGVSDGLLVGLPASGSVTCPSDTGGRFWVSASTTSAPLEAVVAGDEVKLGALRFHNECREDIFLGQVGLKISAGDAQSIENISLWHENTLLGWGMFMGLGTNTTVVFNTPWKLEACTDTDLVIHAELARVGPADPGQPGPIAVNYDGVRREETSGVGGNSGVTINSSSHADTTLPGVVMFEGLPALDQAFPASSIGPYGTLMGFQMSARGSDVQVEKVSFLIRTTGLEMGDDLAIIDQSTGTLVGDTPTVTTGDNGDLTVGFNVSFVIPAGMSKTFTLRAGTIDGLTAGATETLTVRILGDKEPPENLIGTYYEFAAGEFVWGATADTLDWDDPRWSNGHLVPGLLSTPSITLVH